MKQEEGRLVNTFNHLWKKLAKSKRYREEFVAAQVKRGIPFQVRTLIKALGLSQEELARRAGLTQGVVSRAANPGYGNLTLNTIIRIAAGFDVAFIGKFVPFSELAKWFAELSEDAIVVKGFEEEDRDFREERLPVIGAGAERDAQLEPTQIPIGTNIYAELSSRQTPRQPIRSETFLLGGAAQTATAARLG